MNPSYKIVLLGAGNVSYHLSQILTQYGHQILQIYSRTNQHFSDFLPIIQQQTTFTTDLKQINPNADLYIIAVSDTAITMVADQLPLVNGIVVHTSGATSIKTLQKHQKRGIFYPLQTFTKSKKVDWLRIPLCIDGVDEPTQQRLTEIGQQMTPHIHYLNDQQRQALHVAAVFANNFTNHLLSISEQVCHHHQVDFAIIQPLIQETFRKISRQSPQKCQTGPAKRGDQQTIQQHLTLLSPYPEYQVLYHLLSKSIQAVKN